MADTGIERPTLVAVTSAAVMRISEAAGSLEPAAATGWAAGSDSGSMPATRPAITSGARKARARRGRVAREGMFFISDRSAGEMEVRGNQRQEKLAASR